MIDDMLVRELARQVIAKLIERQKKALVVYTGTEQGTESAFDALRNLKKDGFTFSVLMSRCASELLDVDQIRAELEPEALWIGCGEQGPEALSRAYETILVPALSVNSAARVANCMTDTAATAVILQGLMRRKTVVLCVDGCCPDMQEQENDGFPLPEALKSKLRSHLETLQSYGAILTPASQLERKVHKAVKNALCIVPPANKQQVSRNLSAKRERPEKDSIQGRVVTARDVAACSGTLRIKRGTLVTQLAKDMARERAVVIEVET